MGSVKENVKELSADVGHPKKGLSDNPGTKNEIKILDNIICEIEEAARNQGISPEDLLRKITDRSKNTWNTSDDLKKEVPVEDGCALLYNVNFSLSQYQQLRLYVIDHYQFTYKK